MNVELQELTQKSCRNEEVALAEAQRLVVLKAYDLSATSETFIVAHGHLLPADVTLIEGDNPRVDGRSLLSQSTPARVSRFLSRHLRKRDWAWERESAYDQFIRTWRPHAVLAEYGYSGVAAMRVCQQHNIPLVVHFHGQDATRHEVLRRYKDDYPRMFEIAAAIVVVSQAMQQQLLRLGAPPEKLHYNPCGVDCEAFEAGSPASAPPSFLAVGRLVDKKAPHLSLLAFERVVRQMPEARFRIIGDGPLLSVCHDLVRALKLEHCVELQGARSHEEVREAMRNCRAFVQHSVEALDGDCEGTPVAVLEAGAAGLPVIGTRHAGIPDVVLDGETGFLVEERDVDGMAAHMLRLARGPQLAETVGQAARKRVVENFSMNRSIRRLWKVIESSIENHSRPTGQRSSLAIYPKGLETGPR